MEDITKDSDRELVYIVMNNEFLYKEAMNVGFDGVMNIINEWYIYTVDQMEDLREEIKNMQENG